MIAAWGVAATLILAVPVSLSRGGVLSLAAGLRLSLRCASRRPRRRPMHLAAAAPQRRGRVRLAVLLGFGLVPGCGLAACCRKRRARASVRSRRGHADRTYRTASGETRFGSRFQAFLG